MAEVSDGKRTSVADKIGDGGNDIRAAYNDPDGTLLRGNDGDDTLRGGKFDDILVGGEGSDSMFGGAGGDQFQFFGDEISGTDTDRIFDLKFEEGDTLVFGRFDAGTFVDSDDNPNDVNAFNGGASAILDSFDDIVEVVDNSDRVTAFRQGSGNNNLVLQITTDGGDVQQIVITNGYSQYVSAGGTEGVPA